MTNTKTAWLALSLLASTSAVLAVTATTWRPPATVEAAPDQRVAQVEPVDDALSRATNEPEASAREIINPDPSPNLRGAEILAEAPPAALEAITNVTNRHWHDANATSKVTMPSPQQIKKIRDSKAELRVKRSKTAANNVRACPQATNPWTNWLRKLSLSPHCTT
jgi:hypothetical protein